MAKTVAFIYGFTEGQWHGKRFRRLLRDHNYTITKEVTEADIVIAHSGGCFDVPKLKKQALLILINPPYWPERSLQVRSHAMTKQLIGAVRPGNQPFYHTHKTARNLTYLVRHARTNRYMMSRAKTFNLASEAIHVNTILVRNSNDPWLTSSLDYLQSKNPNLRIVRMSGDHDDCWLHPERYINLLQSKRTRGGKS